MIILKTVDKSDDWRPVCSCNDESTCTFLCRKVSHTSYQDIILRAPHFNASKGAMDVWLGRYNDALNTTADMVRLHGPAIEQIWRFLMLSLLNLPCLHHEQHPKNQLWHCRRMAACG